MMSFRGHRLCLNDCKAIGKVLSDFKHIRELDLCDSGLTRPLGKEVADGLIRAKQLEVINLSKNASLECSQILYNLAFSPKIRHIDLTDDTSANTSDTAEALYKLIKISGSI